MQSKWTRIAVSELVAKGEAEIKTGPFGTQLHASDYVDDGTPVLNAGNIGFGDVRTDKLDFISTETVQKLASHLLQPEDIVFGRKGTVERHAFIRDRHTNWFQGTDCLRLRLKSPSIEPRFVSYYLLTEYHKEWIKNQSSHGSTMTSLNQGIIGRIVLNLPPLPTQRRIVEILSAYDDLIENNIRRIRILERMAQSVYREWFGQVNAESLPEGWEVTKVGEAFETLGGSTPSTKKSEYWENGSINWFSPSDLTANKAMFIKSSGKKINEQGLKNSSAKMFPPYCVMMTSRATIGVVSINTTPACTNQGFITCIPNKRVSAYQIYFWILENLDKIDNVASGATYKEIGRGEFREFDFIIPDKTTKQKFDEMISPIGRQIEILLAKNANLRWTRDLLLPRLVGGEVAV